MKRLTLSCLAVFLTSLVNAQIVANSNLFSVSDGTEISTTADITNNGTIDLGQSILYLRGSGQAITNNSMTPLTFFDLIIDAGDKTFDGEFDVTNRVDLLGGIVNISSGRLILRASASQQPIGVEASYFTGEFYNEGTGLKTFPIGTSDRFTPITLTNVNGTDPIIGLKAFNVGLALEGTTVPDRIENVSSSWHWELIALSDGGNFESSPIELPLNDEDASLINGDNLVYTIVQVDANFASVKNIGGQLNGNNVRSTAPATDQFFALAAVKNVKPQINNVITPFQDNANDYLRIQNITFFPDNEVILLDRWGTEVFRRANYQHPDDPSEPFEEDFSFLAPGNYMCIFRYIDGDTGVESIEKQTITVIKKGQP
ncbi:MAG: gliding motility-associated C-terminal domain-containing protein [Bacteroidota bacterium]